MKEPDPPTRRQLEILDIITKFWRDHGCSPTLRELMDITGITSPNGIHTHLKALVKKGDLERERILARSMWPAGLRDVIREAVETFILRRSEAS